MSSFTFEDFSNIEASGGHGSHDATQMALALGELTILADYLLDPAIYAGVMEGDDPYLTDVFRARSIVVGETPAFLHRRVCIVEGEIDPEQVYRRYGYYFYDGRSLQKASWRSDQAGSFASRRGNGVQDIQSLQRQLEMQFNGLERNRKRSRLEKRITAIPILQKLVST
jgi:hypothetical protein